MLGFSLFQRLAVDVADTKGKALVAGEFGEFAASNFRHVENLEGGLLRIASDSRGFPVYCGTQLYGLHR